jgi:hypothetical protein
LKTKLLITGWVNGDHKRLICKKINKEKCSSSKLKYSTLH